jgi:hypothetical protein
MGLVILISTDQVVGLAESWYLSFCREPEGCAKPAQEEEPFDGAEGDTMLSKACILGVAPF